MHKQAAMVKLVIDTSKPFVGAIPPVSAEVVWKWHKQGGDTFLLASVPRVRAAA